MNSLDKNRLFSWFAVAFGLCSALSGCAGNRITKANYEKIMGGMTLTQVEAILGKGFPSDPGEVFSCDILVLPEDTGARNESREKHDEMNTDLKAENVGLDMTMAGSQNKVSDAEMDAMLSRIGKEEGMGMNDARGAQIPEAAKNMIGPQGIASIWIKWGGEKKYIKVLFLNNKAFLKQVVGL
jgi:hypothetical protein